MSEVKLSLLKEILDKEFAIDRFQRFAREFFNGPYMFHIKRDERVWLEYKNTIGAYYKIAGYKDGNRKEILILAVELKKGAAVERARSLQRNFISKILDGSTYDASIVAFFTPGEDNWRLSFVKLDYNLTAKGVVLGLTPARRFSYLVGKDEPKHTAIKQLLTIFADDTTNPTLEQIEEAFSVEKVTKDFFNQYRAKYLELKEYLENNDVFIRETNKLGLQVGKFAEQFSKKLMGQLAFLYFLQKKGWLGVRIMPSDRKLTKIEFEQIYKNTGEANRDVLLKVFKIDKDGKMIASPKELQDISDHEAELLSDAFIGTKFDKPWGSGEKTFIKDLFDFCNEKTELNFFNDYLEPFFYDALNKERKNHYFKRFNCKIPFLNGGLFEPIEDYHWRDINFDIPNSIFSNENEKGNEADGILDIFNMYNFTMNEDEPLEKEVAIDPEMLGKIFENLLDVKDRKSKGAFYTPREIVHYMCQESLINYLVNKVGVPYDDMKEFILYGEMIRDEDSRMAVVKEGEDLKIKPSIYENIVAIDEALKDVKVADPAVGSGAFPLGMLNEIVRARNNITEYIIKINEKGRFGRKYDEQYIRSRRSEYKMKWETIKNSIFAVDIEPSAVDIAKLRLWLSVVVDQEIDENNPEPHPLPNLDQNIMVGNSLIDEYEGIKLFDESLLFKDNNGSKRSSSFAMQMNMLLDQSDELLNNMFKLQDRYFDEKDEDKKKEIKSDIDNIREELIRYKLENEGNKEGIKRYEESLENKTKPYFIWELEFAKVFKDNGGFDIVIGNPPYIDSEEMVKTMPELRKVLSKKYITAKGNWDIFVIFIEKGLEILKQGGTISFIVPNKLIGSNYTKELRKIMLEYSILELRDYSSINVFKEADVYPVVFRLEKKNTKDIVKATIMGGMNKVISTINVEPELFYRDIYWDRYITERQETIAIIEKFQKGTELGNFAEVKGASTVSEAYEVKKVLLSLENGNIPNGYKRFINTGTIDRYVSLWGIKNTKYIKENYFYPVICREDLRSISLTRENEANKEKIIVGGMNKYLECYLDFGDYLAGKSTTIIYDSDLDLRALVGILNSKTISFYYSNFFKSLSLSGGYLRIGPPQLKMLPIIYNSEIFGKLIQYYNNLIFAYEKNDFEKTEKIESEIESLVYKLYGLNEKEIVLIEESIKF